MSRKQGDVSRRRRVVGPRVKRAWYAKWRAVRFARRLMGHKVLANVPAEEGNS